MANYLNSLLKAVRGGKVTSTNFLDPSEADSLAASLKAQDIKVHLEGGFSGAIRRVLTAFPSHIPKATAKLSLLYFETSTKDELITQLQSLKINSDQVGDIISFQEGWAVIVLASVKSKILQFTRAQEIKFTDLAKNNAKAKQVIVPSFRVDALGAKAFNVSRSYFSQGIANGKVWLQGKLANKASTAKVEDEIYAEGLGRFRITELQGETKKGNYKIIMEIEKSNLT